MKKNLFEKPIGAIKSFVKDENGAELLEIAVGILLAVALIATVAFIVNMINGGLEDSQTQIIDAFDDAGIHLEPGATPAP